VRLHAQPSQIQSITIPARLNYVAGWHIFPAVVLYDMKKLVYLIGLQVKEINMEWSATNAQLLKVILMHLLKKV
jgi:hypothetical protein